MRITGAAVPEQRQARVVQQIDQIDAADWDRCAGPENPFTRHAFLAALEASGSVSASTGWQPFHLALNGDADEMIGAVPLYLKGHSQGEYVFDHAWADAWHRAGGSYYPKLQCSVPFTPATGSRLLTPPGPKRDETEAQLVSGCVQLAEQLEVSSLHFTFLPERQWQNLGKLGLLRRMDQQFHWRNRGYGSFDEFLGELSSKKRKNLRRERREALSPGIEVEWLTGSDLQEHHWDAFYRFYLDTGDRKWGRPYLTRSFFSLISETMADQVLLIMCRREGRYIAGALNFIGADTLFGRNWGCIEDHRFLHFEICYYQAIDFAITHGLDWVEAGAQGGHKVARGYGPRATYSAHWIRDAGLRDAIERYLEDERDYVRQDIEYTEAHTPFRKDVDLRPPAANAIC
ncbi:MAG: N-acetyltransferase [Gammaproteobacteria bacterium]|nr:MAG: N-acetyltransferase [Gammaproteobacteria bacterium]TDJ39914.1 MAG: N-acetyltransferase [Gammaproteobacteria bacterium]